MTIKERHDYVLELLEIEPDNLKMIAMLERLQEGEPEAYEASSTGCVAIGYTAGFNVTGSSNIFIGKSAGKADQ